MMNKEKSSIIEDQGCIGVVLAGGLSSRMGQDKASLIRNNINMLQFTTQLLNDVGLSKVLVSGNNYDVPDVFAQMGPVAAIYSVLKQSRNASALLISPVDLPLLDSSMLAALQQRGEKENKACFYQDNWLPLYLPVTRQLHVFLEQAFANVTVDGSGKGPSMRALLGSIESLALTAALPNKLLSANTPEQWQQLAKNSFNVRND